MLWGGLIIIMLSGVLLFVLVLHLSLTMLTRFLIAPIKSAVLD